MRTRSFNYWIIGCCLALLSSCSGYEKIVKSDDVSYKLTKANEYFDKKQYQKANGLYESLLPVMKGTKNFEALYFRYAYSSYYLKDYLSASYHFKNFVDYFPSSKDAEESEYMHSVSLYNLSPKPTLEQTNTLKAMDAMQSYINTHPNSKRVAEANKLMEEMRLKLEAKDAGAAKLYYNISQYKAASIAYKSILDQYPESPNADLYQYMIVRSLYFYADASTEAKQAGRYANAVAAYNELKEGHPKSRYVTEAEEYYSKANNNINKLRNEHQ